MDRLKQKIVAIDIMAEALDLDEDMIRERVELQAKVGELEAVKISDLKRKAKVKWALEGDENSIFFHGIINKKSTSSRIHGLKINGIWVSDPGKIKDEVHNFFKRKFEDKNPVRPKMRSGLFKRLSDDQRKLLEAPFEMEEVKATVWSCGNNKAPGPDGFSFEFIKKFWNKIGGDIFEAVKFFEDN
ncbi:hypothetical protein L6452_17051 [Arctium lappa]|uniref:Uncharacterized protein n=1 Tax=Arctium lappa TaxID=4217 RepID=A0ACB9C2I2_ARCLA|nr:hypothetical protein L6452_17051 [Arctium lappa]